MTSQIQPLLPKSCQNLPKISRIVSKFLMPLIFTSLNGDISGTGKDIKKQSKSFLFFLYFHIKDKNCNFCILFENQDSIVKLLL